jgi:hypothetical protein
MVETDWHVRARVQQVSKRTTEVTIIRHQPARNFIMEAIEDMRKVSLARDLPGLGRWALCIPLEDREKLGKKYPDPDSTDPMIKSRAYAAFIASDESKPYRMRDKV